MDRTEARVITQGSISQQSGMDNVGGVRLDLLGTQLGNYRLVQLLAEGGFASIYLAEHVHLNSQAAIKVMRTQISSEEVEQFREEARIIARLRHPHIINLLDFGIQNTIPFLVMDYAPNGTLRQRHPKKTVLAPTTIASYIAPIASALQYIHQEHLIHRDVKPENILIGLNDEILLGDFGSIIATQTVRVEAQHEVVGTLAYMSPEQFLSESFPASDQYSLAIVVYEWLCGQCPFSGSPTEIAAQHLNVMPPSLTDRNTELPLHLEQVVFKALSKKPTERYPSIQDFAEAFLVASSAVVQPHKSADFSNNPSSSEVPDGENLTKNKVGKIVREKQKGLSRRVIVLGLIGFATSGITFGGITWYYILHQYFTRSAVIAKNIPQDPTRSTIAPTQIPGKLLFPAYQRHHDGVNVAAWSPILINNVYYVASGSKDKTVRVWTSTAGADIRTYTTGHTEAVNAVAWSPDGRLIASGSDDKTVQVWTALNEDNKIVVYDNHSDSVMAVAWSSNGENIASAGRDETVQIWNVQDTSQMVIYNRHTNAVNGIAWSPGDTYIASASADMTVQVWDPMKVNDGTQPIVTFTHHSASVNALAWSPDGRYIASASSDTTVQIWQSAVGNNPILIYDKHTDQVNSVAWSPDGERMASASHDGTVHIWNVKDGSNIFIYKGHSVNQINPVYKVAWSPDGRAIASASADMTVQVWSI